MTDHIDASSLAMFREALLAPDEAASVRAHLAGCARCRQAESQFALVSELLASTPAPPMPAGLSARIVTALAAEAAARQAGGVAEAAAAADPPLAAELDPDAPDTTAADTTAAAAGVPASSAGVSPDRPAAAGGGADAPAADRPATPAATGRQPRSGAPRPAQGVPAGAGAGPGRDGGASRPAGGRPPRRDGRFAARRRARLRALAAAAAVAAIGGGGYAVAQLTAQGGLPAAGSRAASGVRTAGPAMQAPNRPPAGQAVISTVTSGTDYRPGQFARQVHAVLARYPAGVIRRTGAGARALPGSSLAGCVHTVTGGQPARLIDVARYDGRPAMVIVVTPSLTGPARAWAVGRDCSATRPDVLARVSVPAGG